VIVFRASFANKAVGRETVTLEREGDDWRVVGYLIAWSARREPMAAETTALSKFACPACGGEANWNAAKQKLVCPFCGTESPAKLDAAGGIAEHDLVAALRRDRRRPPRLAVGAAAGPNARAATRSRSSIRRGRRRTATFCGSAQIVPYDEAKAAFRPESVLRSGSAKARRATASARGTAGCGSRRTG